MNTLSVFSCFYCLWWLLQIEFCMRKIEILGCWIVFMHMASHIIHGFENMGLQRCNSQSSSQEFVYHFKKIWIFKSMIEKLPWTLIVLWEIVGSPTSLGNTGLYCAFGITTTGKISTWKNQTCNYSNYLQIIFSCTVVMLRVP